MFGRIVSIQKMVTALQEKCVGKKEFYTYAVIFVGLSVLACYLQIQDIADVTVLKSQYHPEILFWAEQIFSVLFSLLGFAVAYWANKSGDNKDYWYRLCSISVPISIRLLLIVISFGFILTSLGLVSYEEFNYIDTLSLVIFDIYGLYLTWHAMRSIATK